MARRQANRLGFAWLESLFAIAILSLMLLMYPSLAESLDARTWSRNVWLVINLLFVGALILIRFAPDWVVELRRHREHLASGKKARNLQQAAKERHESRERARQSMRRRIY